MLRCDLCVVLGAAFQEFGLRWDLSWFRCRLHPAHLVSLRMEERPAQLLILGPELFDLSDCTAASTTDSVQAPASRCSSCPASTIDCAIPHGTCRPCT